MTEITIKTKMSHLKEDRPVEEATIKQQKEAAEMTSRRPIRATLQFAVLEVK